MKIKKCFFCKKITHTPIQITEIKDDGAVETIYSCQKCREAWWDDDTKSMKPVPTPPPAVDVTHITTAEDLLAFIAGCSLKSGKEPCGCGMTEREFDANGRFGCPACYTHFSEKVEQLVLPYHKGREHNGKRPTRGIIEALMADPVEKEKILKLRYAKALELEEYEKCAELKKELDLLKPPPPQ